MADVLVVICLVAAVLFLSVLLRRNTPEHRPRPFVVVGGPKPKILPKGTTATWRPTMSQPSNDAPFPHTTECKTPDARPEWYPIGKGHHERVCTCRKEISYPPMWRRPDIFDPKVMQHRPDCEIADKPELLKHAVTVKKESTYDFATCGVCTRNWYAWDAPPVEVTVT